MREEGLPKRQLKEEAVDRRSLLLGEHLALEQTAGTEQGRA